MIDTVLVPLAGGLVIGVACALLLLGSGRVAGISGILDGAVGRPSWRWTFLAGLVAGGIVLALVRPAALGSAPASLASLGVAGFLVGVGTRLAGGCTSGHGVCGVSRLSTRSMVATATFIATGMITVAVAGEARVIAFVSGLLFALGLGLAGMTQPAKIIAFLDVTGAWDPSLLFVMAGAIGVMLPAWRFLARRGRGLGDTIAPTFDKTHVDGALVAGAAIFGVGWGLSGYCPGPALVSMAGAALPPLIFVFSMIGGMIALRSVRY